MREFSNMQSDPLAGAEVMDLIGVNAYDLQIPARAKQVKEIVDHFATIPSRRYDILKLVSGRNSISKLETVWTHVQLQKEKSALIRSLNPSDFAPDIEKQLVQNILTADKQKQIKEAVAHQRKVNLQHGEIFDSKKLNEIEQTVDRIADVSSILMGLEK